MKKKIIIALLFVCLICVNLPSYSIYAFTNEPLQYSKEEQYKNIFSSLLLPYIQKSVNDYYIKYLTDGGQVDPWDIEILSVERPNNNFEFVIKMQVRPYVGPHISIGIDHITITVEGWGGVKVNKFEHIQSDYLKLPPNWQHIIRKS
jgi:hypothetical protein